MQKWRKSKSIENYSKSISFHEIKSLSFRFETVKNLEFLIQDHISKQEKVLWKGAKNLPNSFILKNPQKWKGQLIQYQQKIHDMWNMKSNIYIHEINFFSKFWIKKQISPHKHDQTHWKHYLNNQNENIDMY